MANRLTRALRVLTRADPDNGPLQPWISEFWSGLRGGGLPHRVAENVGAASRSLQLTSQNIGALTPVQEGEGRRPAWMDDPDPGWFNGFTDAFTAAAYQYYRHGDAFLFCTSRYAGSNEWQTWTVIDAVTMNVTYKRGARVYAANGVDLEPRDVLQVSRQSPTFPAVRSKGALEAYWANMNSAVASDNLSAGVFSGMGIPQSILRSKKSINAAQAAQLQNDWMASVARRYGAPAVLPPDLEFEKLSWSPKELMLLELREFDTRAIASAFGVPAMLLNVPVEGGLTYQNPAALFDFWWRSELRVTAHKFERAMSARMMPRGKSVRLDPGTLLLPDFVAYAAAMAKGREMGDVSADEYRTRVFGLPPLPNGQGAQVRPLPQLEPGTQTDDNALPPAADDAARPPRLQAVSGITGGTP